MTFKQKIFFTFGALLISLPGVAQRGVVDNLYKSTTAARYVNPFIGTAGEGYTYPGATSPWGMVSAGPHTTYTTPLGYVFGSTIAPAGYYFGEPHIEGFGQTHLSGVACNELGAPLIAVTAKKMTPGDYESAYSDEVARAGYYSVMLDDMKTKVEITTTDRTAFYRFQFMGEGPFYVLLDAYKNLSWAGKEGYVQIEDGQAFSGWTQTGNFCNQGNKQKVYFYLKSMTKADKAGLWKSGSKFTDAGQAEGRVGAWLSFERANIAQIAVGISYVSMENAKRNLEAEAGHKDFDAVLRENIKKWETVLGRVRILDEGREQEKEIFYTALYHALLHPNIVSDVNGDYPLYEKDGYGTNMEHPRYGLFSMWDTYRNVHALLSLLYPERQQDMLYTVEDMTLTAGHPPRWELHGSEVNLMVGDPALSILAEGVRKGFSLRHPEKLLDILYRNATDKGNAWRPGNKEYLEYGYIPEKTKDVWGSVSTTLEYSYHDWALAELAAYYGRQEEAEKLKAQSKRWRILFDTDYNLVRPRKKDGGWLSDFDPDAMDDSWWVALFIKNHGGPGFVEGNAWQYTFMVPHDIDGLIALYGSAAAFGRQLKSIFEEGRFTMSNEPDLLYPYLLGVDPALKTYMQQQLKELRSVYFTASPGGIPGNDDAGALSAWYVFSALGFYPVNPAGRQYMAGVPLFNDITIRIPDKEAPLRVTAGFDVRKGSWDALILNGDTLRNTSFFHEDIINGGHLKFVRNGY